MLERQIARCGVPPRQIAADGGYASQDNLKQAKARGVKGVAFHKKRRLAVEDMVRSRWVYRKLRNFAPGSRPESSASSEPAVWHAAPGAGSITSSPTSGPRW
jgi:transposase, IS5 family